MEINPVDLRELEVKTANIYEAIIVASKRARQINDEIKIEFNAMMSTIPTSGTDDETENIDNPAQLRISLDFEKREKPHLQALNELLDGQVDFEYRNR
jgi:DNA-directed RNA polymerase subunit K/omega